MGLEKSYIHELFYYDFILLALYNLILSYLLVKIAEVGFGLHKKVIHTLLAVFQINFFIVIIDLFFNFLPDTEIQQQVAGIIHSSTYPVSIHKSVHMAYYISLLLSAFSLNNVVFFQIICLLLLNISFMIVIKSGFSKAEINENKILPYVVMLCIAPILYMQFTAPNLYVLSLLVFAFFILKWVQQYNTGRIRNILFPAVLLCITDFAFLLFIIPSLLWFGLAHKKIKTKITGFAIFFLVCLSAVLLLHNTGYNLSWFAVLHNNAVNQATGLSYGIVEWNSFSDWIVSNIFIVLQFILNPLPVFSQYNLTSIPFLLIDLIFFLILAVLVILQIHKILQLKSGLFFLFIWFCISMGIQGVELFNSAVIRYFAACILIVMLIMQSHVKHKLET